MRRSINQFCHDIHPIGSLLLDELTPPQRELLGRANTAERDFEYQVQRGRHDLPITVTSHYLPKDYALPFLGPATLIFEQAATRMAGIDILIELTDQ